VAMAVLFLPIAAELHATTHDFYKGKTFRIIVRFPAGGGFDTYSRAIARHIAKHIPGDPTMVEGTAGSETGNRDWVRRWSRERPC